MSVSSYGGDTKSSGIVKIVKDLDEPLEDKDVLIVEDIIEEVIEDVVEVVEDIITPDEPASPEAQEEAEYFDSLKELLNGNIKTVVENLSNAALSDEDKIALLDFEQQDKNRKAVITAINEL